MHGGGGRNDAMEGTGSLRKDNVIRVSSTQECDLAFCALTIVCIPYKTETHNRNRNGDPKVRWNTKNA